MRYLFTLSILLALPLWTSPAWAGPQQTSGQDGTVVSLSASVDTLLPNDEVVVQYRIEATGSDPATLQRQVNTAAARVDKVLAGQHGLRRQTTGRQLHETSHFDKASGRQVHDGWRLVQGERVTSHRLDAVPAWVDGIEKAGAHLDGLSFKASRQSIETAMQRLRLEAIARFRAQAATLAGALGASSFSVLRLRSDERRPVVPMQRRYMAMSANQAQPTLNAGESRAQLIVSGDILLPHRAFRIKRSPPKDLHREGPGGRARRDRSRRPRTMRFSPVLYPGS